MTVTVTMTEAEARNLLLAADRVCQGRGGNDPHALFRHRAKHEAALRGSVKLQAALRAAQGRREAARR